MAQSRGIIPAGLIALGLSVAVLASAYVAPVDLTQGVQDALDDLQAGHWEAAERDAESLAKTVADPNAWRAWIIAAEAGKRLGEYERAAEAYQRFLGFCDWPDLRDYSLDQIRACRRAGKAAAPIASPGEQLTEDDLRELAAVEDGYFTESGEHFTVRARNARLARLTVRQAEASLERIRGLILGRWEYPHSVDIVVWADRAEYLANASDAPEWSGGSFSYSVANGLTVRRIDLTQLDSSRRFAVEMFDRVLPHELCHLVLREYFGDAACPLLINEGMAMMVEWKADNTRLVEAAAALSDEVNPSLDELLVARRQDVERPAEFYAEAFSFVSFLHSRLSAAQFQEFLVQVKGGCTVGEALQRALYVCPDEEFLTSLAAAWQDYAVAHVQYLHAVEDGGASLSFAAD